VCAVLVKYVLRAVHASACGFVAAEVPVAAHVEGERPAAGVVDVRPDVFTFILFSY
jgi:hypothetical protein